MSLKNNERINEYRIMWIFVMFDLPTETAQERKDDAAFRKNLIKDGFNMFQYSIYVRHCASKENKDVHAKRIKAMLPQYGQVVILSLTDKQFGDICVYTSVLKKERPSLKTGDQLELF